MSDLVSTQSNLRTYRVVFAALSAALLALPLVAMQFTREVNWQAGDFLVFAGMLLLLGGAIELAIRFAPGRWMRAAAIGLALTGFIFVWAMLATG